MMQLNGAPFESLPEEEGSVKMEHKIGPINLETRVRLFLGGGRVGKDGKTNRSKKSRNKSSPLSSDSTGRFLCCVMETPASFLRDECFSGARISFLLKTVCFSGHGICPERPDSAEIEESCRMEIEIIKLDPEESSERCSGGCGGVGTVYSHKPRT